ncbi:MAG: FAD-binding oxidoreductase [Rhabdochlamydiaceae bacterium]|nr:FAD-binding oxidoreductase [Rhabdochlamydiaceae bacterium]
MKIAIIGAGLSGLSLAWKLLESGSCQVTLFDPKGIGGGASGVASGLMHPYVGEQGRRSQSATEGLAATRRLLSQVEMKLGYPVARYEGIVRIAQNEEQRSAFEKHVVEHGDIEAIGGGAFWIRSGVTVHCGMYLEGLWQLIASHGGVLERVKIDSLHALSEFDRIVIAAGFGVKDFAECEGVRLKYTKGQILRASSVEGEHYLDKSLIGKGYVALGEDPLTYHLGSTYEKQFTSDEPQEMVAKEQILPKILSFFPEAKDLKIKEVRAGVRVVRPEHYFPITERLNEKCFLFTALGSRGLLYHALLAEQLKISCLR